MQIQMMTWQLSVKRVKPNSEELIARYNAVAHRWQQKIQRLGYHRAYAHLFAHVQDDLRSSFAGQGTAGVLDCGVGTGALSVALYRAGHGDLTLHGVDTSSAMVIAARTHLARQGVPILIDRQNVRSLSYADNTFRMVMAAHTIEHLPRPEAGIREMARVLRPGSPLLIVTTRPSLLGSLVAAQWGLTCLERSALVDAFVDVGLRRVRLVPLGGPFWCRRMSYGVIGWKSK